MDLLKKHLKDKVYFSIFTANQYKNEQF